MRLTPFCSLVVAFVAGSIAGCVTASAPAEPSPTPEAASPTPAGPLPFTTPEMAAEAYATAVASKSVPATLATLMKSEREAFALAPNSDPNWELKGPFRVFTSLDEKAIDGDLAVVAIRWLVGARTDVVPVCIVRDGDLWWVTLDHTRHEALLRRVEDKIAAKGE